MSSSDECNEEVESVLIESLLPAKSKKKYLLVYDNFMKWKAQNNEKSFSEKVFLAYFNDISKTLKPSSLWGIYSMLKTTMRAKQNIYLKDYINLLLWLKTRSIGFKSKKSKILTQEDIKRFLNEAPDEKYLATKVALILGVCGACHVNDLTAFAAKDIKTFDDIMLGVVHDLENKTDKMFTIREDFIPVVKKYQALRPFNDIDTSRFFFNYKDGHCTKQVIGRHKMASFPRQIANYLQLPNPERYTGHCFRRSAAAFGSVVRNVDKRKKPSTEETGSVAQEEIDEMVHFAKRYRREDAAMQATISLEVQHVSNEVPVKTEVIEPTITDEVHIKTEEIEQSTTDELDIQTEEVFDPLKAFGIVTDIPTTSEPSASGRESRTSDVLMINSDQDEDWTRRTDEDSVDLVHIKSENVNRNTSLQALREDSSQETSNPHDTKITVAGKNITILFKNCSNVGNVIVNIINK